MIFLTGIFAGQSPDCVCKNQATDQSNILFVASLGGDCQADGARMEIDVTGKTNGECSVPNTDCINVESCSIQYKIKIDGPPTALCTHEYKHRGFAIKPDVNGDLEFPQRTKGWACGSVFNIVVRALDSSGKEAGRATYSAECKDCEAN